uniref:Uncharacterized protein n=1 Tax=Utricularia reniformis TaxID=192314 RepID=A0A1Y0B4B4_9LAMI|nr:hypothetical protein AEK19_MT2145 [Utricularia reniformis]ART32295.1 hypothetical protein AEK19_MT2145 [Utricularia reniformis]
MDDIDQLIEERLPDICTLSTLILYSHFYKRKEFELGNLSQLFCNLLLPKCERGLGLSQVASFSSTMIQVSVNV